MVTYEGLREKINEFIKNEHIDAYTLARVAKDLCRCGCCRFFVQHYSSDGKELDFGHCVKGNIPKSKKPYEQSCGSWEDKECGI